MDCVVWVYLVSLSPTKLLSGLKSTVAGCGLKICISSHDILLCKTKKTRLSNVVKPARVRLGYCLAYIFASVEEIWIQISLLLMLSMFLYFWGFFLPFFFFYPNNGDEKWTFKNKTQINIIVSYLGLCENKLLFSWLKQKRVLFCLVEVKTSTPIETNVYCYLHGLP